MGNIMIITSTTKPKEKDYTFDLAILYLWELLNAELIKPYITDWKELPFIKCGFAQNTRVDSKKLVHGEEMRIKETLRDMEKFYSMERGILQAKIICLSFSSILGTLSKEQFIHQNPLNKTYRIFPDNEPKPKFGGSSEMYFMDTKTAKAKFANCHRQLNQSIGYKNLFKENGEQRVGTTADIVHFNQKKYLGDNNVNI